MANIIFVINTSLSHFYSSFWLAGELQRRGYRITYVVAIGDSAKDEIKKFKEFVESRGFGFSNIKMDKLIVHRSGACLWRKNYYDFEIEVIRELINELRPDVIFLDSFLVDYALILHGFHVRTILIQTMMCLDKAAFVPPINSDFIPIKRNISSYIRIEWAWWKIFLRRFVLKGVAKIYFLDRDIESRLKVIARAGNFDFRQVFDKRPFTFGIKSYPELVLSPMELDFIRKHKPANYHYIGPMIDMGRDDKKNEKFASFIKSLSHSKFKKIIYCSLGTMATEHNAHCLSFFQKVISIFKNKPDHILVLSTGSGTDTEDFPDKPDNVHLFRDLPQIRMLERADLMLTAAGINSITECILSGVPMIVFPLNSEWDQNGNAARVVYHHIGLRGNVGEDSAVEIERKINFVLHDHEIRNNINRFRTLLSEKNASLHNIDLIESIINDKNYC